MRKIILATLTSSVLLGGADRVFADCQTMSQARAANPNTYLIYHVVGGSHCWVAAGVSHHRELPTREPSRELASREPSREPVREPSREVPTREPSREQSRELSRDQSSGDKSAERTGDKSAEKTSSDKTSAEKPRSRSLASASDDKPARALRDGRSDSRTTREADTAAPPAVHAGEEQRLAATFDAVGASGGASASTGASANTGASGGASAVASANAGVGGSVLASADESAAWQRERLEAVRTVIYGPQPAPPPEAGQPGGAGARYINALAWLLLTIGIGAISVGVLERYGDRVPAPYVAAQVDPDAGRLSAREYPSVRTPLVNFVAYLETSSPAWGRWRTARHHLALAGRSLSGLLPRIG